MVTKNQIKLIVSLQQKKNRLATNLFFVEGRKGIQELLDSNYDLEHLYQTEAIFDAIASAKKTIVSHSELIKMSALTSPNNCLAIFTIPKPKPILEVGLIVVLDDIRDPGNLGTIIRLCDWFGVSHLLCSQETVDIYNPKVIQATMGSISRVAVSYIDIEKFIVQTKLPVFGTFMDGNTIYEENLPATAAIVMGNEANGISKNIEKIIKNRLAIPRFGNLKLTESLNVATATAIVLSEFRR